MTVLMASFLFILQLTDLMACLEMGTTVEQLSISNESRNDSDLPVTESCASNGTEAGKGKKSI